MGVSVSGLVERAADEPLSGERLGMDRLSGLACSLVFQDACKAGGLDGDRSSRSDPHLELGDDGNELELEIKW